MQIKMKVQIAGSRNGVRWPEAGSTVDLPDNEAHELIEAGLAEAVKPEPKAEPKVASPETRPARKAEKRR